MKKTTRGHLCHLFETCLISLSACIGFSQRNFVLLFSPVGELAKEKGVAQKIHSFSYIEEMQCLPVFAAEDSSV